MGLQTGQIIEGKYRILKLLGEGGMGSVYEGENLRIHRKVAIKVLHAGIAENVDAVARFEREAQAAGRIGSDHIVQVLDLGNLPGGDRFMVMEFLDGQSLSRCIQAHQRLTPHEAVPLMVQLLEGLAAAHGAGIIHRDLKPDNVYLIAGRKGQGDFVKILDFGISKFNKLPTEPGAANMSMTRTGAVMGTPYYMSPEQAKGSRVMDHRSDLYSAGVILYEAITGRVPFNAETFNELIFKIVLEVPAPPEAHAPGLDPSFSALICKAMAREPSARFQSAQEFAEALSAWASGPTTTLPVPLPAPRLPEPSAPVLGQTPPPWASGQTPSKPRISNVPPPPAPKSKAIAIAAVGLGIAAVIVVAAVKLLDQPTSGSTSTAVLPSPPTEAPKSDLPKNDPQNADPKTELANSEPSKGEGQLPKTEVLALSATPTTDPAPSGSSPSPMLRKVPAPGPLPGQKHPLTTPTAPTAAPSAAPTSTGRRIRTEL